MDNLEEDLTCSVCYSLFADPRVLPCSHTFCKGCLDNVLQASNNYSIWRPLRLPLKCPNCRDVVELPPTGVDALPSNVSLRAIVEKFQKDSQPQPPSCPDHPRQPLNVYCVLDRQLICGLCLTVGGHQGHPIDDLQAAFLRERQAPARLLGRLADRRWDEVSELGQQLAQEKARCEALVREDRQAVEDFFQGLELALAQKREAFQGALDAASVDVCLAYDPLIQRLKELQEEQRALVSLGGAVEEESSPLVFLEKVHGLRERVNALVQAPLPAPAPLSIAPRAAHYLEQRWAGVTVGALEQEPVPRVTCCTPPKPRDPGVSATEAGSGGAEETTCLQLLPAPTVALLLGALALLAAVWMNPVGGASLGFSLLSQVSQTVHGLGSELSAWLWEAGGDLYTQAGEAAARCSSVLSAFGEMADRQLVSLWKSLSSTT